MRPLADLLVADLAQADPRLNVAHIPHCNATHPFLQAEIHYRVRRLMQQISLLPVEFGTVLRFALEQALRASRSRLTAAQFLLQEAVNFVAPLLA
jgi:hypothetical protein